MRGGTADGDLQPCELSLPAFLAKTKESRVMHRATEMGIMLDEKAGRMGHG